MDVAGTGVFLEGGDPGEFNGGALDALAECGDGFDEGQESR